MQIKVYFNTFYSLTQTEAVAFIKRDICWSLNLDAGKWRAKEATPVPWTLDCVYGLMFFFFWQLFTVFWMALWLDYNRRSLGIYHTCTLGPIILSLEVKAMLLFCNKSGRRDIRIPPSSIPENEAYFFMKVFCCVLYVDSCILQYL